MKSAEQVAIPQMENVGKTTIPQIKNTEQAANLQIKNAEQAANLQIKNTEQAANLQIKNAEQLAIPEWMENRQCQTILRYTQTIIFEFNPITGAHFVSPFISEILSGNYDDRQLSQVMVEDGVLHPDDLKVMADFHDRIIAGESHRETISLRLKTREGDFRWYRMSICVCMEIGVGIPVIVGTIADVNEETLLREKQHWLSLYDDVTGIYNKASFFAETQSLLASQPQGEFSLVLFDVDRFKMVNALFGMETGDNLLRFIGKKVAELAETGETYGRIRDDVFCLCVRRSEPQIIRLIEDLRVGMSDYPISFSLTLSIGIYHITEASIPVSFMCDRATLAMKTVKGKAVGSFAFYDPAMGFDMTREQRIMGEMQIGIRTGQFHVYYQPKHNISDGRVIGAEALVRWIHPENGMIPPSEFIELFEQNGLIMQLDEYVWESVCRSLQGWLDRGIKPPPVSVNVSRVHLYDPNLCDKFIALTEKYDIPPALLEIELTESAYVENPHLGTLMKTLQKKGFAFLMDDFGSGYSSLNMLRNIPVDVLKLDLHFLGFTDEEPSGKIIMESVIQMAQRLNIPIIAEGVETADQVSFLNSCGCRMAQGFYYSRPMPLEEYEREYLHI